jgi:MFS family permease
MRSAADPPPARADSRPVPQHHHVRALLRESGFRRLYATRLAGQFGDGVFQASLAGAVLFSPERQAHPSDIAVGFAILLLPYSLIGPFAGVLIDRWWRQRVLVIANLCRGIGVLGVALVIAGGTPDELLYLAALLVLSVNRFVLASLSACLPHVARELVSANAFSTTSGALSTALGGAVAIGVRAALGSSDRDYAIIAAAAALPYLIASLVPRGFDRATLGPDELERARRDSARDVFHGLLSGVRHVHALVPVRRALTMIGLQRLGYGIALVSTLLLYRNYFVDDGIFRAQLGGLGQIAGTIAAGTGLAALITPAATRRLGPLGYPVGLLVLGSLSLLTLTLQFRLPAMLGASFVMALVSQGIKICVDTLVQTQVSDEFRGRVFSLYDTLFNITTVTAAILTALLLPESGRSPAAVIAIAVGFLVVAAGYLRLGASATPDYRAPTDAAQPSQPPR